MLRQYTASQEDEGKRLDVFLTEQADDLTRSAIQKLVEHGAVTQDGAPLAKNKKLKPGDCIAVDIPPAREDTAQPQDIPLEIIYEDSSLLVVNKPKGMVVHPAAGNWDGTLVNALLYHCKDNLSGINGIIRPGIVHRIDKDTSGLLLVAKTDEAHQSLAKQIKAHTVMRSYETIVIGRLNPDDGAIDLPIGRHPLHRKKMTVTDKNSRHAVTHYRTISVYRGYSHVECKLETGRTHQIRVHLSHLGHPVLGDTVYGAKKGFSGLDGQCLHARAIGFVHPTTGKYMEFTSELPDYFLSVLKKIDEISQ